MSKKIQDKKKLYQVKIYLIEEYKVEATSKQEAINKVSEDGNPYSITTVKITAKTKQP
jgi:hypothetical protein